MKRENRDKRFMIRMKPSEWAYIERESDERGQKPSEYVRAILFANAVIYPNQQISDGAK